MAPTETKKPGSASVNSTSSAATGVPSDGEIRRRAVVLVEPHVVEGRGILRPHHRAGDVGHDVGEVGAAVDVADARRVEFGAGLVGEPGEQPVVGRMLGSAEPEERLALRERVAVEQELLLRVLPPARPCE